jgi:hypothetical protein
LVKSVVADRFDASGALPSANLCADVERHADPGSRREPKIAEGLR